MRHCSSSRATTRCAASGFDPSTLYPSRRDPCRVQPLISCVGRNEVQPPSWVQDPVARKIEQQKIIGLTVGKNASICSLTAPDDSFEQRIYSEITNRPVGEHACQCVDVLGRCRQLWELRVLVVRTADQQRDPRAAHPGITGRCDGRSRSGSAHAGLAG
jgi:hypothetical protein